jgi:ribose-phosphate pyrophosphokinase
MSTAPPLIFSGNANKKLAKKIANEARNHLQHADIKHFSDGEISVQINANVRGRDCFIIQPTCAPANNNLMELLIMADALRRSSAAEIIAVIPYYGYSRQDKQARSKRVPITAKLVANMIEAAGIDHIITMDLHSDQLQGFFNIPVDNIYASPVLLEDIKFQNNIEGTILVAPDTGAAARTRAIAQGLGVEMAIIDKRRERANESEVMNVIGSVKDRHCIFIDDMIDTAGTMCHGANALMNAGALSTKAYASHAVLSGAAIENIENSHLTEVVVTDTIPLSAEAKKCPKVRQASVAPLLAETIRRVHNNESISQLFE